MTRLKAKRPALGALLAAAVIPLLLPLVQQPSPALAIGAESQNYMMEEATNNTSSIGLTTSVLQEMSVSDGHPTSAAIEQETTFTLTVSVATITQSQSQEYTSESTASAIAIDHEPTTITAAPTVTSTLELSSTATTAAEVTTKDSDGEALFSPQLSTSRVAESSLVETNWTSTSQVEETTVQLETTVIMEGTTSIVTASTESSRSDDQTDSQTSIDPFATTTNEHTNSQATTDSQIPVRTSTENQITKDEVGTHTQAPSRTPSDSPSAAGLSTRGDSSEAQQSTTAQNVTSEEAPISTSDGGGGTTEFPQRRLIHAVATYGVDYGNVTTSNLTELFKESFTTALTIILKIDRTDIKILMVEAGSIRVHFEVNIIGDGVEQAASDLKNKTDELHAAFVSSVQNNSMVLAKLLEAAGKPSIMVHVMPASSAAPVSGAVRTTAAPKTPDVQSTSKSLTDGEIAGVVIGSVLGGLLLVAILTCICRRRSSGNKLDEIASGGFKARSNANYEMVFGPGA